MVYPHLIDVSVKYQDLSAHEWPAFEGAAVYRLFAIKQTHSQTPGNRSELVVSADSGQRGWEKRINGS